MEMTLKKLGNNRNVLNFMLGREVNADVGKKLKLRCQFTEDFIKRLGLEVELEGHQGCVNCLEWSPNGLHLASGSDDTNIILWDPFRHKRIEVIPTPHVGNIFSVKFLGDENVLASVAGDCRVIVQTVNGAIAKNPPILDCSCHVNRVKRLATCPDQPTLFWSAGEDGLVLQFDMREPHECPSQTKVLIELPCRTEIKCIAVNPTKPHYIAIGSNDCFVRMFDRRMLKIKTLTENHAMRQVKSVADLIDPKCVQYYAPGHLTKENTNALNVKLAVTYIAFNSAGTEMLANIGGEQIYLFDVNNNRHTNELRIPQMLPKRSKAIFNNCCSTYSFGNENSLISQQECACFYMKRAFRSYQRKWVSDLYGASRDYLHVIQHWPDNFQAFIGLIKCMIALKWIDEGYAWLRHLIEVHPNQESNLQVKYVKDELESLKINLSKEDKIKEVMEDDVERALRLNSFDFEKRYLGHCNTTTDIKEANFLGEDDSFICAGSDEGIIFIWNKKSMEIVNALVGDNSIVNCIQPHPSACVVASSGIDHYVKIWSPMPEDGKSNARAVRSLTAVVESNQQRMCMDPFESMLASMGYQFHSSNSETDEVPTCRTS